MGSTRVTVTVTDEVYDEMEEPVSWGFWFKHGFSLFVLVSVMIFLALLFWSADNFITNAYDLDVSGTTVTTPRS